MYKCWLCGSEVAWESDFMESEIDELEDGARDRVVGYYYCYNCGSEYEFRQGPREE